MSLYVKGESKPNVCEECWFHVRWNRFEDLQCGLNDGKIIAMNTWEYEGETAIPDWCPLVEVPELHGRLIDAEDVKSRMIPLSSFSVQNWISEVELSNCMTVIEAEGE